MKLRLWIKTKIFDVSEANYNYLLQRTVSILGNLQDAEEAIQDLAEAIMTKERTFAEV